MTGNESAFPEIHSDSERISIRDDQRHPYEVVREVYSTGGMTKREHFAALAYQGLLANPWLAEQCIKAKEAGVKTDWTLPQLAVESADALLKALSGEAK